LATVNGEERKNNQSAHYACMLFCNYYDSNTT